MDTKEEHIFNEIRKIQYLTNSGKNREALNLFSTLERKYANNPTVQFNKVGLLIDNGSDLKEPRIVESGVKLGEKLLAEGRHRKYVTHLNYNLANGYDSLYRLYWDISKGLKQTLANEYLQKAKRYYRNALEEKNNLNFGSKKQLLTNYANCLSSLGRNLEALYLYDEVLKAEPSFGMALGNYAEAMWSFASISGAYINAICIDAHQKLKSALEDPLLPHYGGIGAQERFRRKLAEIKNWLDAKNISLRKLSHKRYSRKGLTDFEKFYLDICSEHKLFLNLHIQDNTCSASIVDHICISIVTPVKNDYIFYELSKYINQIKEDYATARLLFAQSQYERKDFNRISKRTDYVYALDYSMFNLYCGLLKSAFTQAYNILDKIALFINEYYRLGIDSPTKIYFTNIWKEKGVPRTRVVDSENFALYGLYDIHIDFESGYYKRIRDIRNAITHRKLVIFDPTCTSDTDKKLHQDNIGYDTMLSETINLLKLVKSAIIYLVNAIEVEERKKRKEAKGPIIPMYADTEQLLPFFRNHRKFRKTSKIKNDYDT